MRRFWIVVLLLLATLPISAQDGLPPIISADNVAQLQSVMMMNFHEPNRVIQNSVAGYTVPRPKEELHQEYWKPDFQTGWFSLIYGSNSVLLSTTRAIYFVSIRSDEAVYTSWSGLKVDSIGGLIDFYYQYDMSASVHRGENMFYVKLDDLQYRGIGASFEVLSDGIPTGIWTDCNSDAWGDCGAWLEVEFLGNKSRSEVIRLPYIAELDGGHYEVQLEYEDLETIPYAPAQDPQAVVRIGRIPLPYVVTSSVTGIVKLWNIQTGEVLYEVDNGTGQPSVFGNINADATHFVWRDNASETLYLLDFETGENREVAQLNGEYAQWFFLSNDASTILAVNLNFEPIVVAWDVETGEKTVLGEYRQCNRPQPDMARLSRDGTTLVIGCDTGLDVWRVVEDE